MPIIVLLIVIHHVQAHYLLTIRQVYVSASALLLLIILAILKFATSPVLTPVFMPKITQDSVSLNALLADMQTTIIKGVWMSAHLNNILILMSL